MKKLLINAFLGAACLLSCVDASGMTDEQKKANEIVDNIHDLGLNESGENLDRYFKSDNEELTDQLEELLNTKGSLHSHFCRALEINDWPLADIIFLNDTIDVKQPNAQGIYPIMFALRSGNLPWVLLLEDCGAGLFHTQGNILTDPNGNDLMYYAIQGGADAVGWLWGQVGSLNPNALFYKKVYGDVISFTPLMLAVQTGDLKTVQLLIQEGAKLFDEKGHLMADSRGNNLLYYALSGELKTLKFLLEQPNVKLDSFRSERNDPVFIEACRVGSAEVVEWLINKFKIDVNHMHKLKNPHNESFFATTALREAVTWGNVGATKVLLTHGADVNLKADEEKSLLIVAASIGNIEIVKMLLQDPKIDKNEITESAFASLSRGSTDILKFLLSQGININMLSNSSEQTLLCSAISGRNSTTNVRILLEDPRINVNAKNHPKQRTALHLAATGSDTEIVRLLLSHPKILVNETDGDGCTPLFLACQRVILHRSQMRIIIDIVQQLLKSEGIDVNKADNNGLTPLLVACLTRKPDIASLLLEYGAKATHDNILYIIKEFPKDEIFKTLSEDFNCSPEELWSSL